jgi:hypothetical protein
MPTSSYGFRSMPVPLRQRSLPRPIEPYRMTYGKDDGITGADQYGIIYGMGYRY